MCNAHIQFNGNLKEQPLFSSGTCEQRPKHFFQLFLKCAQSYEPPISANSWFSEKSWLFFPVYYKLLINFLFYAGYNLKSVHHCCIPFRVWIAKHVRRNFWFYGFPPPIPRFSTLRRHISAPFLLFRKNLQIHLLLSYFCMHLLCISNGQFLLPILDHYRNSIPKPAHVIVSLFFYLGESNS